MTLVGTTLEIMVIASLNYDLFFFAGVAMLKPFSVLSPIPI